MAEPDLKEDLPFRHYTLKHRLIAWISINLFDTLTYTVRHGLLKGMKRKGGLGWVPALFSPSIMTAQTAVLVWSQSPRYDRLRYRRLPRFADAVLRFAGEGSGQLRAQYPKQRA